MTPQLQNALLKARNDLRETAPLIHCITNPIAINDCANGILAVGGKPIMAHLRFDECQGGENGRCADLF